MTLNKLKTFLFAILIRLGLVLFGLILGLLALEIMFRWLYPDPSPKLVNQALQRHDTYGIAFTPNVEGWNSSLRGEYSTYITINDKGLRGEAHDYEKEANTCRILTLGDSFTAGLQVTDEQLFTTLLEQQLNNSPPRVKKAEVINAGVVGYGSTNELAYFMHEGYKYQPDIVLLMFFTGNDVLNNINPPHYNLENGSLVPIEFAYNPDVGTPPWAKEGTLFRNIRNFLYTNSRLYSVMIELVVYSLIQQSPQLTNLLQSMGFVETTRPMMNAGNIYSFLRPSDEAWTMTEALLLKLNKEVQLHGSALQVVIIPDETEINLDKWNTLFTQYPDLFDKTTLDTQPTDRLAQMLEQHDIPFLQLRPAFEQYQQGHTEPIHYQYDGHWKPIGHTLAANVIFEYLISHNLCE